MFSHNITRENSFDFYSHRIAPKKIPWSLGKPIFRENSIKQRLSASGCTEYTNYGREKRISIEGLFET